MINHYSIFHLNLAYSSIEEEQREEVIAKCYYPLIELACKHNRKIALEIPGYTLKLIHNLNPVWVLKLNASSLAFSAAKEYCILFLSKKLHKRFIL